MSNGVVHYRSKKINFDIPITAITDMKIGRFSRLQKPITLNYLEISYNISEERKTVLLVPTKSWSTSVWKTNEIIKYWLSTIQSIKHLSIIEDQRNS